MYNEEKIVKKDSPIALLVTVTNASQPHEEVIIRVLDRAVDNFTRPIKFNPMMTF